MSGDHWQVSQAVIRQRAAERLGFAAWPLDKAGDLVLGRDGRPLAEWPVGGHQGPYCPGC